NSDAFLHTGSPEEICPLKLSPTTSTTVMTVIGDIIVSLMIDKIDFSPEEYAKRHHSGYLGEKSKQITKKFS
ncbi:MAG: iron dicitrate transport regulator FecR, partial [Bacteroidota bacterium]|nr:iron dicitrate transport regulator FecR [Bacteroidota bacterium]